MKKVFAIIAIAGFMVACNNKSEKKTEEIKDSANNMMNNMVDSANNMMDKAVDSVTNMMNNAVDSAKNMMPK